MSSAPPPPPEESSDLAAPGEKWLAVALSTGPGDREAAREAARELYLRAGLKAPDGYVWLDSPLEGIVAATVFQDRDHEGLYPAFGGQSARRVFSGLNLPGRGGVPPAPAFEPLRVLCARAVSAVADQLRRAFPARTVFDTWREVDVPVEPGPEAYTAGRLKAEVFAPVMKKLLRQRPHAFKPARWRRSLEPFRSNGPAERLTRELSFGNMPGGDPEDFGFGTFDAWRLAVCENISDRLGPDDAPRLAALSELSRQCGWWWPLRRLVIFTERPSAVGCEPSGRLHAPDGPALAYADGWEFYAWRGMEVPADLIKNRERLTVGQIEGEYNVELRRAMIDIYGQRRFLLDGRARVVHQDEFGTLYVLEVPHDEPLVMVEVHNSTPEPDGSYKDYFLRVPPQMKTAREAVAWTFGMEEADYAPSVET